MRSLETKSYDRRNGNRYRNEKDDERRETYPERHFGKYDVISQDWEVENILDDSGGYDRYRPFEDMRGNNYRNDNEGHDSRTSGYGSSYRYDQAPQGRMWETGYRDGRDYRDHGYGARPSEDYNDHYSDKYYYDPADEYDREMNYGAARWNGRRYDEDSMQHPHYNYYESYPSYGQGAPYNDHERSWNGNERRRDNSRRPYQRESYRQR